jgi:hypothetical protein
LARVEIGLQIPRQDGIVADGERKTYQRRVRGPANFAGREVLVADKAAHFAVYVGFPQYGSKPASPLRATKLVNVPLCQLQNGSAKVPGFLRLSNDFGESDAPTSHQIQTRPDQGSYPWDGSVAFPGVAGGSIAGAGDHCAVLAGDAMWLRQLR